MWRTFHRIEKNSIAYDLLSSTMDNGRHDIFVTRAWEWKTNSVVYTIFLSKLNL